MFRRLGAEVVHGPAIATLPAAELDRLRRRTEALIATPPDYVVANTGLGVRQWLALAASWDLADDLREALLASRIVARGPKAAGALRLAGLPVWWRAPDEQLSAVARHLIDQGIAGCRVAFQLHGDDRQDLTALLSAAGATVSELPVYRWTLPEDAQPAVSLIERCCEGTVDVVTFTAGPAVRNLFQIAAAVGREADLLAAFESRVLAACIGPVCAAVATDCGIATSLVPEHWRLGSMVRVVSETLVARSSA